MATRLQLAEPDDRHATMLAGHRVSCSAPRFPVSILLFFLLAACSAPLVAQHTPARTSSATRSASAARRKSARTHKHVSALPAPTAPRAASMAPPAPKPPDWPANDHPSAASVTWNSQGLQIQASNSSLRQILSDVSTATGTKIEGLSADQRIFGVFGPGKARDVLSHLLDGSGYNVLMIGDQGQGTPRQVLLTPHTQGGAPSSPQNSSPAIAYADDNTDNDDQSQPEDPGPPSVRNGFAPPNQQGMPPRSPQQIMQEMQQHQQQVEQMQQQSAPQ
jgi:hypothetical protein